MNSKLKITLSLLGFIVFLGISYWAYVGLGERNLPENPINPPTDATQSADNGEEKLEAIDFTVYDSQGNAANLSDFFGKPIILNFWATWCPYCVEEMPYFEESYQQYGEDIHFLMIDSVDGQRETQEKGEQFIEDHNYTFPVYYDTEGSAVDAYHAYSLPTSVFIDHEGFVVAYQPGMLTPEYLQMGIDMIYEE